MRPLARLSRPAGDACALLVTMLSLAACADGGASTLTTSTPTPTTRATMFDNALWPDPAHAVVESSPAEVARSFVEDFVGMASPAFGEFQQGDTRSGEIPMFLVGEDGRARKDEVLATIALRQLDGRRWFVIAAFSDDRGQGRRFRVQPRGVGPGGLRVEADCGGGHARRGS